MKANDQFFTLILVAVSINLATVQSEHETFATCKRTYDMVGCYNDWLDPRPLPQQIINDRDVFSDLNDGHIVDYTRWKDSMHSLACRCAAEMKKKGYRVFGLQFYGECWSGPNAEKLFNKDGEGTSCIQDLQNLESQVASCNKTSLQECTGGALSNYIYKLQEGEIPFKHMGCYYDGSDRSFPNFLGAVLDAEECFTMTKKAHYKAFGIQNGQECWSGPGVKTTYSRHGESKRCSEGKGGPWSNDVYFIDYQLLGCFTDDKDRALPTYLGPVDSIGPCFIRAKEKGHTLFALQNGYECWSGPDGIEAGTYKKHGESSKCWDGMGGTWSNSVYHIVGI